uniref:Uncharacterized protein n=1 Tax=Compsopogon caeruleus TaxID=31354 RepID=A0A7S1TI16_9RHOD|mmetsp:Transcript_7147/g.14698  ORF Transcript_7147/g.14698 Transcript_7147/m.14698 type:complete len:154 (+) Transcript_7147:259-720(+)
MQLDRSSALVRNLLSHQVYLSSKSKSQFLDQSQPLNDQVGVDGWVVLVRQRTTQETPHGTQEASFAPSPTVVLISLWDLSHHPFEEHWDPASIRRFLSTFNFANTHPTNFFHNGKCTSPLNFLILPELHDIPQTHPSDEIPVNIGIAYYKTLC